MVTIKDYIVHARQNVLVLKNCYLIQHFSTMCLEHYCYNHYGRVLSKREQCLWLEATDV